MHNYFVSLWETCTADVIFMGVLVTAFNKTALWLYFHFSFQDVLHGGQRSELFVVGNQTFLSLFHSRTETCTMIVASNAQFA